MTFKPDEKAGPFRPWQALLIEPVVVGAHILRAALSNLAGFNEGQHAERGGVTFAGLMFYNEEGQEEGGLVGWSIGLFWQTIPSGGQDADVTLTMDQYHQDQNAYLHHEEHEDPQNFRIEDGLSINARPNWTEIREEYGIYAQMDKMTPEQRDQLRLRSVRVSPSRRD